MLLYVDLLRYIYTKTKGDITGNVKNVKYCCHKENGMRLRGGVVIFLS